ncbi:MAG: OsmC family protein [Anaerolineaceae bacterium]|nr:OsmC family protein [Anaerolineaceae bacterium]
MAINKTIKVEASLQEGFQIELKARNFTMYIDQPESMGGKNIGPNPLEYQLFSLAGCICTIGKIVAKQQKIILRGLTCSVEGGLNSEVFMGKSNGDRAGFQDMSLVVNVDADMTQEQKEAFIHEVDKRCPVSDTFANVSPLKFVVK